MYKSPNQTQQLSKIANRKLSSSSSIVEAKLQEFIDSWQAEKMLGRWGLAANGQVVLQKQSGIRHPWQLGYAWLTEHGRPSFWLTVWPFYWLVKPKEWNSKPSKCSKHKGVTPRSCRRDPSSQAQLAVKKSYFALVSLHAKIKPRHKTSKNMMLYVVV